MDLAATGLATLTFLGAGHTEKTGKHKITVRKAIKWIIGQQAGDGRIGRGTVKPGLQHAVAALALAEAFGMARVPMTGAAAQKAVDYSTGVHAANGRWGYWAEGDPSTLLTAWFVMQLRSVKVARLRVDARGYRHAARFLDKVTGKTGEAAGRSSFAAGGDATPIATAAAVFCRTLMGWKRDDPVVVRGAKYLAENLPAWKKDADFHYWYWGSLAMFQMGGDHWRTWNRAMRDMLVERQRKGLPGIDGSWDPMGGLLEDTGRVGSTAMAAMCLEVYYRYLPLYK
jgi:hypothetical protein